MSEQEYNPKEDLEVNEFFIAFKVIFFLGLFMCLFSVLFNLFEELMVF